MTFVEGYSYKGISKLLNFIHAFGFFVVNFASYFFVVQNGFDWTFNYFFTLINQVTDDNL